MGYWQSPYQPKSCTPHPKDENLAILTTTNQQGVIIQRPGKVVVDSRGRSYRVQLDGSLRRVDAAG